MQKESARNDQMPTNKIIDGTAPGSEGLNLGAYLPSSAGELIFSRRGPHISQIFPARFARRRGHFFLVGQGHFLYNSEPFFHRPDLFISRADQPI